MTNPNLLIKGRRVVLGALAAALATVSGLVATPGVASAASFVSFDAGVFAPDQVKHYWWNNADADAYAPGMEGTPTKDLSMGCNIQVVRSWYQRNSSGEREFHLEIRGDHHYECRVKVWLAPLTKYRETSTGELAPGASKAWVWNNAHSEQNVYVVGVLPAKPAAGACSIEVTNQYRTQPDGETEFIYRARNIGSVACSAQLKHVSLPAFSTEQWYDTWPGGEYAVWPPTFPYGTRVVVAGAAPDRTVGAACQFSVGPISFVGDTSYTSYTNTGSVWCGLKGVFAAM